MKPWRAQSKTGWRFTPLAANTSPTCSRCASANCPRPLRLHSPATKTCSSSKSKPLICLPTSSMMKSAELSVALEAQLSALHLLFMREHYQALASEAATKQWSHLDYLARLIEGEA